MSSMNKLIFVALVSGIGKCLTSNVFDADISAAFFSYFLKLTLKWKSFKTEFGDGQFK